MKCIVCGAEGCCKAPQPAVASLPVLTCTQCGKPKHKDAEWIYYHSGITVTGRKPVLTFFRWSPPELAPEITNPSPRLCSLICCESKLHEWVKETL